MINLERLAREAGLTDPDLAPWMTDYGNAQDAIERFAALVAEECAKLCEEEASAIAREGEGAHDGRYDFKALGAEDCAAAIREAVKPSAQQAKR